MIIEYHTFIPHEHDPNVSNWSSPMDGLGLVPLHQVLNAARRCGESGGHGVKLRTVVAEQAAVPVTATCTEQALTTLLGGKEVQL